VSSLASPPLWVALVPLGLYLVWIGSLHLRRRPVAVTGVLDILGLAAGLAGLAAVGPLPLLEPIAGPPPWGVVVLALVAALAAAVAALAARPRLVVYNVTREQLRPVVAGVAAGLDPTARWAGETVAIPGRGLQVQLDARGSMRCVSLVAVAPRTSPEGWAEFSRRVRTRLRTIRRPVSPWAAAFIATGTLLVAAAGWLCYGTGAGRRTPPPRILPTAPPADAAPAAPAAPGASHVRPARPFPA